MASGDIGKQPRVATMTVSEAGERLGISRGSAYAAAKRGEIPTIKIGRLLLVPTALLDRKLNGA